MTYRLPDGGHTSDAEEFVSAWEVLADKALSFFPGYIVSALDPNLVLTKYGTDRFGAVAVVDSFTLSVEAIKSLRVPETAVTGSLRGKDEA